MMKKLNYCKTFIYPIAIFFLLSPRSFALSRYKINNKSLIDLDRVKDEVSTKQASTNANIVIFDYSKKEQRKLSGKTIDQKLYERPLSDAVKNAIRRAIGNESTGKMLLPGKSAELTKDTAKELNLDLDLEQEVNDDYSTSDMVKRQEFPVAAFVTPPQDNSPEDSQFILKAREINLSTHKNIQAHTFEFIPDYERTERVDDSNSGEISLNYSLSGDMNTQTGLVQAVGMIPTRVELNLDSFEEMEVPLINEEGIQLFLQKQGLSIEGNLILLAVDSAIADVEIDSHFAQRFYFDENFNLLPSSLEANYVMFAGVRSGNVMLRYLFNNKEMAQKVVYVGDGEMYFENPSFFSAQRETFIFTTSSLLGQKKKWPSIPESEIYFLNTNIKAKKKALNTYKMKIPTLVSGMRKYFEFKHFKESIFLGTTFEKKIEMPGRDFIAKILEMNQINTLKERCVVQVNISKDLEEIKVGGKNRNGEMFIETSFLDKEGGFSYNSKKAEKAFIIGDMEGQLNVRLNYTDGSTEFLKTFCSEGGYLVEQI